MSLEGGSETETMDFIVWEEIRQFKIDECPDWTENERLYWYFLDFFNNLPSNSAPGITEMGIRKGVNLRSSLIAIAFYAEDSLGKMDELKAKFTDKRITKKYEDFFTDIFVAINEVGISIDQLMAYVDGRLSGDKEAFFDADAEMELVLPVFIRLREMEYSYADLTE